MRIASWNVNSLKVRLPQVLAWLDSAQPDVLGLQETKLTDENFPVSAFNDAGWHVTYSGQKTYNGVALVTRTPATDVLTELAGADDPSRRLIAATVDSVRIYNLYVPNGKAVDSDKYVYKLDWLAHLHNQLTAELDQYTDLVAIGDYNIAPSDADVHDPVAWAGSIHCSTPERDALGSLEALGLRDTFRLFDQPESAFSWWDYRAAGFRRNLGLRIDLILASAKLAERCTGSRIDVEPRRNERPSDHAPVIADFA